MPAIITTPVVFNGTYTITNGTTGEHRTFRVKTQKDGAKFAPGERVAALLTGSDNISSYTGFGFVKVDRIAVWTKKRGTNGKRSAFDFYAYLLNKAGQALINEDGEDIDAEFDAVGNHYRVQLSKRCLRCNRKLTNPESIERGYGPECANALGIN